MENELKFTFPNRTKASVLAQLKKRCAVDSRFPEGRVNSIYFDTREWDFAMDKASSDYLKCKVRVRWYEIENGQNSAQSIFLEIKQKVGKKRLKDREPIPIGSENISNSINSVLFRKQLRDFIAKSNPVLLGKELKPALKISYTRNRFIDEQSGARISLDSDIVATTVSIDSLTPEYRKIELAEAVLEVKGELSFLPPTLRTLVVSGFKLAAYSKYYEAFLKLSEYSQ